MSETGATAGRQNSTTQSPPRSGAAENEPSNPSAFERTMKQLRGNPLVVVLVAAAAKVNHDKASLLELLSYSARLFLVGMMIVALKLPALLPENKTKIVEVLTEVSDTVAMQRFLRFLELKV